VKKPTVRKNIVLNTHPDLKKLLLEHDLPADPESYSPCNCVFFRRAGAVPLLVILDDIHFCPAIQKQIFKVMEFLMSRDFRLYAEGVHYRDYTPERNDALKRSYWELFSDLRPLPRLRRQRAIQEWDPTLPANLLYLLLYDGSLKGLEDDFAQGATVNPGMDFHHKRSKEMLDNLLREFREHGVRRALLKTGGVHIKDFTEMVKDEFSIIVLQPLDYIRSATRMNPGYRSVVEYLYGMHINISIKRISEACPSETAAPYEFFAYCRGVQDWDEEMYREPRLPNHIYFTHVSL